MSFNWNNAALQVVVTGLNEIPVVGSILGALASIFWPQSQVDVWSEIKDQVQQLIDQQISQDTYDRVQAMLGSAEQGTGLIGVVNNYLGSVSTSNNNGQDPKETWTSANEQFVAASSAFEQQGSELLLLPLFAQMANLHLSLLRDGVLNGYCDDGELQGKIDSYGNWADQWVASGAKDRQANSKGAFNYLNEFDRTMQLGVGNFRELWPYFAPKQFPPPVKNIAFPNEIYYTITELMGGGSNNYNLPAAPSATIGSVAIYWLQDLYDNYNLVQGTQVSYSDGTDAPYCGVLVGGNPPPVGRRCDPNNDYFCYFRQIVTVNADNPIISVKGVYEATGGIYCTGFGFKDGSTTAEIPQQANQDYPHSYSIDPPSGYYLSSIWVPGQSRWYNSAADMVFGFRLSPADIDANAPPAKAEAVAIAPTTSYPRRESPPGKERHPPPAAK